MTQEQFAAIEKEMLAYMQGPTPDPVHNAQHIYRVLYAALQIAKTEPSAKMDVVILAALLHDIGRPEGGGEAEAPKAAEKNENSGETQKRSHALLGAEMAAGLLPRHGWSQETTTHVCACIATHSYRRGLAPQSIEAKILFDADKLDLTGAIGTARAMLYGAQIEEPLYLTGADGQPTKGSPEEEASLLREYNRKLCRLPQRFFTEKGRKMADKRQKAMDDYFQALEKEINKTYNKGAALLRETLEAPAAGKR